MCYLLMLVQPEEKTYHNTNCNRNCIYLQKLQEQKISVIVAESKKEGMLLTCSSKLKSNSHSVILHPLEDGPACKHGTDDDTESF